MKLLSDTSVKTRQLLRVLRVFNQWRRVQKTVGNSESRKRCFIHFSINTFYRVSPARTLGWKSWQRSVVTKASYKIIIVICCNLRTCEPNIVRHFIGLDSIQIKFFFYIQLVCKLVYKKFIKIISKFLKNIILFCNEFSCFYYL